MALAALSAEQAVITSEAVRKRTALQLYGAAYGRFLTDDGALRTEAAREPT